MSLSLLEKCIKKLVFLFSVSLLSFFSPLYSSDNDKEEFYIFGMGQGNSQLAIYNYQDNKFGILYDCGSVSSRTHPKIKAFQDAYTTFFSNKTLVLKKSGQSNLDDLLIDDNTDSNTNTSQSQSMNISFTQSVQNKKDFEKIKDIVDSYKLNDLFIFLSHPDKDHINYLNENTIPDNTRLTVFLGGDWLGDGGQNSQKDDLSNDVKNVLTFLAKRQNTTTEFPFYWNYEGDNGQTYMSYMGDIYKAVTEYNTKTIYQRFSKKSISQYSNKTPQFQGNLNDLLNKINTKNKIKNKYYENVYTYFSNFSFDDVNSQSIIVILTMPKLEMNFVCTGDAHNETFEMMPYEDKKSFLSMIQPNQNKNFLTLLMLPHHGSLENFSKTMFKIFKPDILGISAGNGGMYSHPSEKIIRLYEIFDKENRKKSHAINSSIQMNIDEDENDKKENVEEVIKTPFTDKFALSGSGNQFIAFEKVSDDENEDIVASESDEDNTNVKSTKKQIKKKKDPKVTRALLHKTYSTGTIPIISTNVHGTIKIDDEGFKSSFSNILPIGEDTYEIDYKFSAKLPLNTNFKDLASWQGNLGEYKYTQRGVTFNGKNYRGKNAAKFEKEAIKLFGYNNKIYYPVSTDNQGAFFLYEAKKID